MYHTSLLLWTHAALSFGPPSAKQRLHQPGFNLVSACWTTFCVSPGGSMALFEYQTSIGKDHIRLLQIDLTSSDQIRASLQAVPLEVVASDKIAYYALSYCWGTEPPTEDILIDGNPFKVSPNLLAGLQAICRNTEHEGDSPQMKIWIDAICINQKDDNERSAQVPLMGSIYSEAVAVIVWLGVQAHDNDSVMLTLRFIETWQQYSHSESKVKTGGWFAKRKKHKVESAKNAALCGSLALEIWEAHDTVISKDSLLALAELLNDVLLGGTADARLERQRSAHLDVRWKNRLLPPTHPFWRDYCAFMTRPWFGRVWTYQEIVLASKAWVLCGDQAVSWKTLNDCRSWLDVQHVVSQDVRLEVLGPQREFALGEAAFHHYNPDKRSGNELGQLRELLLRVANRDASWEKDFIYGLLGVAGDLARTRIRVDYSLSDADVYCETIAFCCSGQYAKDGGNFWVGLMETFALETGSRVVGLPSWCPDFSSRGGRAKNSMWLPGARDTSYQLSSHSDANHAEVTDCLTRLKISAVPLDTIMAAAHVVRQPSTSGSGSDAWSSPLKSWGFELLCSRFYTWLTTIEASFASVETDLCEIVWPLDESKSWLPDVVASMRAKELNAIRNLCVESQRLNLRTQTEAAARLDLSFERCFQLLKEMAAVLTWNKGRHLFVTSHGRVGHSAKPAEPGDLLCYFPGGGWLHLLRPQGDAHRYTSAACVGGLVKDTVAKLKNKKITLSPFTLV